MAALTATLPARRRPSLVTATELPVAVLGGLLVGLTESLLFALALVRMSLQVLIWRLFGWTPSRMVEPVLMGVVVVTPIAAGLAYGWLLHRGRSPELPWWRYALIGPYLWLSSFLGLLVAKSFEPLAENQGDAGIQLVFRTGFTLASGLAALVCSACTARTLGLDRVPRRAVSVALITAASFLVVASILGLMPAWHVGAGDMAMPRVALVANLLAGTIGGTSAFRGLTR